MTHAGSLPSARQTDRQKADIKKLKLSRLAEYYIQGLDLLLPPLQML